MSGESALWRGVVVAGEEGDDGEGRLRPVPELPLVIFVGVTGVGKTTMLRRLESRVSCTLLPDRRSLADRVVFPSMQSELGLPRAPIGDRVGRFRLTAAYRERHPGGMAHALSRLRVDPSLVRGVLVFDGLRGADEVGWAAEGFPLARFIALQAPASVRLARLLERGEAFDQAFTPGFGAAPSLGHVYAEVRGLEDLVSPAELEPLLGEIDTVTRARLAEKARIVVAEAENYDPDAALRLLSERLPEERLLVVDTARTRPDRAVEQVVEWLG